LLVTVNLVPPFRRDGSEKRSVSEFPGPGQNPPSPDDPLERLYYLHDGMGVIGPIKGFKLKEMIESGAVGRGSNVNLVGAPNWTPLMEFAPFPDFFKSGEVGPDYGQPRLAAAPGPRNFASFWIRLGAHIIDNVLTLLLLTVVALIFSMVIVAIYGAGAEEWALANSTAIGIVEFVPIIAYYAYFSAGSWQATPGKRICGIYVIRTNGERLDAPFGALRYLTYFLSALPLGLGFLMPLWTKERKALHDIICGTRVVYGRL
jgi:uncharacterized RDD family membrane protein YckC